MGVALGLRALKVFVKKVPLVIHFLKSMHFLVVVVFLLSECTWRACDSFSGLHKHNLEGLAGEGGIPKSLIRRPYPFNWVGNVAYSSYAYQAQAPKP